MKLYEMTAHMLSGMLRSRKLSVVELTQAYLDRIDEIESAVGSYITVLTQEALKQAEKVQIELDNGADLPPLAGIPAAVKDNICTEGILTTCASRMLSSFVPPYNATVIQKLYEQKAILLGKLNMDEYAMGGSTESSYFKQTRNPWNTERVPGGSSGGPAASVAGGEAVFALGSDTGGSIRQPAAFCGVVGMKPTYGVVSRFGLVALASSFDHLGPLTKDVTDCALVLNAISGYDKMDSTSAPVKQPDYMKSLINDVKGMKIGIPKEYIAEDINADVKKAIFAAAEVFGRLGATCEECSLPKTEYAIPAYSIISAAEASSNMARYDGIKYGFRAEKYDDLLDLYKQSRSEGFGAEVKRRIMMGTYVLSSDHYDAYYKKALQVCTLIKESFDEAFKSFDMLLGPTAPTTAFKIGEKADNPLAMYCGNIYTVPANIAGVPALTLPCGFDNDGLPIGLQLIGKPFAEGLLIRAGYTFEQNTGYHMCRPEL